tara:strand:+ start:1105 stop:1548 length:444 start_codon:yes stop_codon:yes gene_type:complete
MRKFRRRKKRGPVVSKKVTVDGIKFASGLEAYMYRALKKAKIKAQYEKRSFELQSSFEFNNSSYERQSNGKGDMVDRGNKKVLAIKYTPDFEGTNFVIECKGRANESFPIRWKLFKKHIADNYPNMRLYKPQRQSECDDVINLIKNG